MRIKSLWNTNIFMSFLPPRTQRDLLIPFAKDTRHLMRERRTMKKTGVKGTDLRMVLVNQEIDLRLRRLAQFKRNPSGVPEGIVTSVTQY